MNKEIQISRARALLIIIVGLVSLLSLPVRADYQSAVLADHPQAYYRFNDNTNRNLLNYNVGSLVAAGNGSNDLTSITGGVEHSMPGAIVGDSDRAIFFDYNTRTEIPFNAALNTPNSLPFSVESWIYPVSDQ